MRSTVRLPGAKDPVSDETDGATAELRGAAGFAIVGVCVIKWIVIRQIKKTYKQRSPQKYALSTGIADIDGIKMMCFTGKYEDWEDLWQGNSPNFS
jgi:hypothetical protein